MDQPTSPSSAFRLSTWLAWIFCGLVCVFTLINMSVNLKDILTGGNITQLVSNLVQGLIAVGFSFVAALIIFRQPRNLIGWLLIVPTISFVAIGLIETSLGRFTPAPPPTIPNLIMTWFTGWSWLLFIYPLFFILLLFPTGKPLSPRWRWVLAFALGMCLIFILYATFSQKFHEINNKWALPNPIGWIPENTFDQYFMLPWTVGLIALAVASTASLFIRYRRAASMERLQIKWLLYSGSVFMVFYTLAGSQSDSQGFFHDVTNLFFILSVYLFPIAIAIAILRYRLWDINVIIRKTLIYAALTTFLALIFFGSVVILQRLFSALTGTQDSPLVVVVSTLVIAALFTPLRRRIQNFIDRRFFRQKYNAEMILNQFAASVRNEVEMDQLTRRLVSVVEETVQPESVRLWLK